ncbi:MAG: hypothetical protein R2746_10345 [Acidimicrobiales bacterium]
MGVTILLVAVITYVVVMVKTDARPQGGAALVPEPPIAESIRDPQHARLARQLQALAHRCRRVGGALAYGPSW